MDRYSRRDSSRVTREEEGKFLVVILLLLHHIMLQKQQELIEERRYHSQMLYLLWTDYSTDPGFHYKDIDYVFLLYIVIYCIAYHAKWLHFRIGVSTHNLFSIFQIYIFDLKITHNKTCYNKHNNIYNMFSTCLFVCKGSYI